jgi:GTP 3',8-cyclase
MQPAVLNSTAQSTKIISPLIDPFGRKMDYLRLAITDRCNLRCQYCMPAEGIPLKSHDTILRFEEMERLIRIFTNLGVKKIRLTGGEPFVRKGSLEFLKKINEIDALKSINITTNAVLIDDVLDHFRKLKIGSLNISIDSLQKERFAQITRRDDFDVVWANIQKALKLNLAVKLNTVVLAGINEDEIKDFCLLAKEWPVEVRFIEQMPFSGGPPEEKILSADQIIGRIKNTFPNLVENQLPNSTARLFSQTGFKGKIGVIAGYSRTFCSSCNRLRITPDGHLKTCLYDHSAVDLKSLLRHGLPDQEIEKSIRQAVNNRAEDGFESEKRSNRLYNLSMAQIGG